MGISLIDAEDEVGNLERVHKDLREAVQATKVTEPAEQPPAEKPQRKARTVEIDDERLPERMRGKSVDEIVEMYRNLESRYGQVANDLGVQRKLSDRLLDLKREDDLRSNAGVEDLKVDSSELLDRPAETIERIIERHLTKREREKEDRVSRLESQLAAQNFLTRHPDYNDIANDPEFHQFVRGTPYRSRVADAAMNGDYGAADELVSEFKELRKLKTATPPKEEQLAAAKAASLESGTGQRTPRKGASSGKIYRRADLLALQLRDPDTYYSDEVQREVVLAYKEGRVK